MINRRLIPDWRDKLRVGDIVKTPTGGWRVVREVSFMYYKKHTNTPGEYLYGVTFTIARCSWTKKPFTWMCRGQLARYTPVSGVRAKLDREIDKRLAKELRDHARGIEMTLTCDDVKGII